MRFVISIEDFDRELLPADAREIGSTAFAGAVRTYYEREFAPLGGRVRVEVDRQAIEVTWEPDGPEGGLFERALRHLDAGQREAAVPLLQALTAVEPTNAAAHRNLGMALSDLGRLDDAKLHLVKANHLDPNDVDALTALGVALYRSGDADGARRRLQQAVDLDPTDGYAQRNLGGVLAALGESAEAGRHLREAERLLPDDQQSVFGYARWLRDAGDRESLEEADRLLQRVIAIDPDSAIAEMARQDRSEIARREFRGATSGPRMDAVMYCLGAMEKFDAMPVQEVQQVAFEIALLGRRGIDVNDPDKTYTLRTLSGLYTGLHLMCLMYVGFKRFAPEMDIGFDVAEEYRLAETLYEQRHGQR